GRATRNGPGRADGPGSRRDRPERQPGDATAPGARTRYAPDHSGRERAALSGAAHQVAHPPRAVAVRGPGADPAGPGSGPGGAGAGPLPAGAERSAARPRVSITIVPVTCRLDADLHADVEASAAAYETQYSDAMPLALLITTMVWEYLQKDQDC